jgi:hypothetical protein
MKMKKYIYFNKINHFEKIFFKTIFNPSRYSQNKFFLELLETNRFTIKELISVFDLYKVGTILSPENYGATAVPCLDINSNIRKVEVYNEVSSLDFAEMLNSHYIKENKNVPHWLINCLKNDKESSYLYGLHILHKSPANPIFIVNSWKNAIIYTLIFGNPRANANNFIFLANESNIFDLRALKDIAGRLVVSIEKAPEVVNVLPIIKEKSTLINNIEVINLVRANLSNLLELEKAPPAIKYHSINPLNLDSIKDEFLRHKLPEILRLNKNEFIYDVGKYYRHQIKQIYSTVKKVAKASSILIMLSN